MESIQFPVGFLTVSLVFQKTCGCGFRHVPFRDSRLTRLLEDSLGSLRQKAGREMVEIWRFKKRCFGEDEIGRPFPLN